MRSRPTPLPVHPRSPHRAAGPLLLLALACNPDRDPATWSAAVPLPGAADPVPAVLGSLQGPGLGINGAKPVGLVVDDRYDAGVSVAWSQRLGHQRDAAPWERVLRTWDGTDWSRPERQPGIHAWVGLDGAGRPWGLRPAVGDQPAAALLDTGAVPIPNALVAAGSGGPTRRVLEAPALGGWRDARRLLVRRIGADIAVMEGDAAQWRYLGDPTGLDAESIQPAGAPALTADAAGRILVAWQVVGELGADGARAAGLAVRLWDDAGWTTLSPPDAPRMLDPWPEGPIRLSDRTRADRRAQARWRKRFGPRSREDWPSPVSVALTTDGPVVAWNTRSGHAIHAWVNDSWQAVAIPGDPADSLRIGATRAGELRIARVRDGALSVHDRIGGAFIPRPGLPIRGAGTPALDGDVVAWRARIAGGHTVRLARWSGRWEGLGSPSPDTEDAVPQPRPGQVAVVGPTPRPRAVIARGGADGGVDLWTLASNRWKQEGTTRAPYAARPAADSSEPSGPLVAWQDGRARGGAISAFQFGAVPAAVPGRGPSGAMLAGPDPDDRLLDLDVLPDGRRRALVRHDDTVTQLQHRGGTWQMLGTPLPIPAGARAVDGTLTGSAAATVALWVREADETHMEIHSMAGRDWLSRTVPADCRPKALHPQSLAIAVGPTGRLALAWRGLGSMRRTAGAATVCLLDPDTGRRLPDAAAPTGGRAPLASESMPVDLAWAGQDLVIAVRGLGPAGPATRAHRWDGTAWQPLASTPDTAPTGGGRLLADDDGACLWWTAEAVDGPRIAIACAARNAG